MEGAAKITGLKEALEAVRAAFPADPKQQRKILNQSMSGAARKTIVATAKQLAHRGDGSGALSEAIAPRAVSLPRSLARGHAVIVEITPVRSNKKALALYINHYYNSRGKAAPANILTSGIRHGHLVEFGTVHSSPKPFLWPAATSQKSAYLREFSFSVRRKIESAVRRKARKK